MIPVTRCLGQPPTQARCPVGTKRFGSGERVRAMSGPLERQGDDSKSGGPDPETLTQRRHGRFRCTVSFAALEPDGHP